MTAPCDACAAGVHCFGRCPCCCREPESGRLAAIRGVLDYCLTSETADRQTALERIEQIVGSTRTASGIEPGGGAYLTPADLGTVLDALDVAAVERRYRAANCEECDADPADLCGTCDHRLTVASYYDTLAEQLGGAQ